MYFYFFKFTRTNRRHLLPQGKHNPRNLCHLCDLIFAVRRKPFCALCDFCETYQLRSSPRPKAAIYERQRIKLSVLSVLSVISV